MTPDHRSDGHAAHADGDFIRVPARARTEIGELTFYLEQALKNLREVRAHVDGGARQVPDVLDDLRDVVQMTEHATVRVLEETEALVEEGRAAARLLAEAHRRVANGGTGGGLHGAGVAGPLAELAVLVERSNGRAMAIMTALEFQDITSQKVHRAFAVLDEVMNRLDSIRTLVEPCSGYEEQESPPAAAAPPVDAANGQALADELLRSFTG